MLFCLILGFFGRVCRVYVLLAGERESLMNVLDDLDECVDENKYQKLEKAVKF